MLIWAHQGCSRYTDVISDITKTEHEESYLESHSHSLLWGWCLVKSGFILWNIQRVACYNRSEDVLRDCRTVNLIKSENWEKKEHRWQYPVGEPSIILWTERIAIWYHVSQVYFLCDKCTFLKYLSPWLDVRCVQLYKWPFLLVLWLFSDDWFFSVFKTLWFFLVLKNSFWVFSKQSA